MHAREVKTSLHLSVAKYVAGQRQTGHKQLNLCQGDAHQSGNSVCLQVQPDTVRSHEAAGLQLK